MEANIAKPQLTETDLAKYLSCSLWTVRHWRVQGRGPKFYKAGGTLVRYRPEDVEAFLDSSPSGGAGQRVSVAH
jgi:hypothetical protein